jgi:hypothetical protein
LGPRICRGRARRRCRGGRKRRLKPIRLLHQDMADRCARSPRCRVAARARRRHRCLRACMVRRKTRPSISAASRVSPIRLLGRRRMRMEGFGVRVLYLGGLRVSGVNMITVGRGRLADGFLFGSGAGWSAVRRPS